MGWNSGIRAIWSGTVQDVPGLPGTLGWDGTVGLEPSGVGHSGHVWDVSGLPGTLGWDGQWAVCSGTLGTCLGYVPWLPRTV